MPTPTVASVLPPARPGRSGPPGAPSGPSTRLAAARTTLGAAPARPNDHRRGTRVEMTWNVDGWQPVRRGRRRAQGPAATCRSRKGLASVAGRSSERLRLIRAQTYDPR